jgi:glycosyltransferase involved in cell wall biosynthesis
MKVVIAIASSSDCLSGVQRHGINVARCLLTRGGITAVHLIAAPWQQQFVRDSVPHNDPRLHLHSASIGRGAIRRNRWYYTQLPRLAAQLKADIVHLAYPSPLNRTAFCCPTVVTLHDLYPFDLPENFGFPKVFFNQLVLQQSLGAADAIACVSESTRARLVEIGDQSSYKKAVTICNIVEPYGDVSASSPLSQDDGSPFLLCVAQHRRNKNILFLLRVFERLLSAGMIVSETRLVIVGIPGPETKTIHRFLASASIMDKVVLLSGISDAELQWCYRNCFLLLAPSLMEGFGLPVAEGLLAGSPVLCSDIPAFREVGGDACQYIPLDSDAETNFVKAIADAGILPPRKPRLLPQLSAKTIAHKYMQLYTSLLAPRQPTEINRHTIARQASERKQFV